MISCSSSPLTTMVPPEVDIAVTEVENALQQESTQVDHTQSADAEVISSEGSNGELDLMEVTYTYPNIDSGQVNCYDNENSIACPVFGEDFFGQDANYESAQMAYVDNGDGTITDINTGLMWVQDAGEKMVYSEASEYAENFSLAGYDDWRIPTIKELYSLMDFSGIDDAVMGTDPFIDTDYFIFEYGDTSIGEREIDSQWITDAIYESTVMNEEQCFFGVNFADGRIKCYPTGAGQNGQDKTYFLRNVRGEEGYGENEFVDNGDGTVTDLTVGLTWQQNDSGVGMDWKNAISYCENLTLAGEDEWRLPNVKELQYIVDYSRSPDTTDSAAIDPVFETTVFSNELGNNDYAYYWSSTTHEGVMGGQAAAYISFGEAIGQMNGNWMDVHGAGAQRSDSKTADLYDDLPFSNGPQGDSVRVYNAVRCVTDVDDSITTIVTDTQPTGNSLLSGQTSDQTPADGQQTMSPAGNAEQPPEIDFTAAAEKLGVNEETLKEAMGNPQDGPPDLAKVAAQLGVSEQELVDALGLQSPKEN